jgi:dihydrofolate synthase/folylpolyglutamate synthase
MNQLNNEPFTHLHLVLGFVNDKDLDKILPLFPKNATYYFSRPSLSRGLDETLLQKKAAAFNLIGNAYNSISEAYEAALKNATASDFIYIGGSTFTVAEVL